MQNQRRKSDSTPRKIFAGCISCVSARKGARLHVTHEQYTCIHKDLNHYKAERGESKAWNNIYHFPSLHKKLNLLKVSRRQWLSSAITTLCWLAPNRYKLQHNDTQCRVSTPLSSLEHPVAYVKCWQWVKRLWLLLKTGTGSNQLWKTHKELRQNISLSFQLKIVKWALKFPRRFHLIFFPLPPVSSARSGSLRWAPWTAQRTLRGVEITKNSKKSKWMETKPVQIESVSKQYLLGRV